MHSGFLPLSRAYGLELSVVLSELSSSIVVRSEHQYNPGDALRSTLRKHIYELETLSDNPLDSFSPAVLSAIRSDLVKLISSGAFRQSDVDAICNAISQRLGAQSSLRVRRSETYALLTNCGIGDNMHEIAAAIVLKHSHARLACHPISTDDKFGRYLGFVDLRVSTIPPQKGPNQSTLAMGLLTPPKRYRHDHSVTLISGEYGLFFGTSNFVSTFYVMHAPRLGGSHCAQACVIMALGALSDRGAKLAGTYEVTYLAKQKSSPTAPTTSDPACLSHQRPESHFIVDGLSGHEIATILDRSSGSFNTSSIGRSFRCASSTEIDDGAHQAMRLMQCYVNARYPLIALVNSHTLNTRYPNASSFTPTGSPQHAISIVGIREKQFGYASNESAPLLNVEDVIFHDPGYSPYCQLPFKDIIDAAINYSDATKLRSSAQFIFVAEHRIANQGWSCLKWLESHPEWFIYIKHPSGLTFRRYDYRIQLLENRDIPTSLGWASPELVHKLDENKHIWFNEDTYWCVTGYRRVSLEEVVGEQAEWVAVHAWFFSACARKGAVIHANIFDGTISQVEDISDIPE